MVETTPKTYRNPAPTVDIIIEIDRADGRRGIVFVERKNPPHGWALPGGFVDYGETLEDAAVREAREETSLEVELKYQFHTYSDPRRDPRGHTIATVFVAAARGIPIAGDDARSAAVFSAEEIPDFLAFDHTRILEDYFRVKRSRSEDSFFIGKANGCGPEDRKERKP